MNYLSLFTHLFSDFSFSQMNPSHPNREQYSELNNKANTSNFMHCVFIYLLQARQEDHKQVKQGKIKRCNISS